MTTATMYVWSYDRIFCPCEGKINFCPCIDWAATLWIGPVADECDVHDEEMADYAMSGFWGHAVVMRSVLDEAFLCGHRTVTIHEAYRRYSMPVRTVSLRWSPRRRRLAAERKEKELEARRVRRSENIRYGIARALVRRIISGPSSSDVRMFFRRWKEVTGYGSKDKTLRDILVPAKEALVKQMLTAAEHQGWTRGRRADPRIRSEYSDVIYIDAPKGQMSFHVLPGTYPGLPEYPGEWSGLRNTPEIVASLFGHGGGLIATAA